MNRFATITQLEQSPFVSSKGFPQFRQKRLGLNRVLRISCLFDSM